MATQYFRITVHHPVEDLSAIFDSNGMFERLWQFSSYLVGRGFSVLEVSTADKFLDGNITKVETGLEHIICRAHSKGKPENLTYEYNGLVYHAVKVDDRIYIPDRYKTGGAA